MGIFDIFNFKSQLTKVFNKKNFDTLLTYATNKVLDYVETNLLTGADKKLEVDKKVIEFIKERFTSSNTLVNFFISLLIQIVPVITQRIYDNLQTYVNGLTKTLDRKEALWQ